MTSTTSQQRNDCVIVAISNATGLSYEDIASRLPKPDKHGLMYSDFSKLLDTLGWKRRQTIPRRGQNRITGIVRMISNKKSTGHLAYMKNGIVFDAFAPNGMPIKEYQSKVTRCHIQMIWVQVDNTVLIDTPPDTEVSIDFLRSLDE